jgi:hypothetical protein
MNRILVLQSTPSSNLRRLARGFCRHFPITPWRMTSLAFFAALGPACASPTTIATDTAVDAAAGMPNAPPLTQGNSALPPTYDELFSTYFDKGTPGHCATPGCHADPGHNVWLCITKDTCYKGMVGVGLIDPIDPAQSQIIDPRLSPLTWINAAGGSMPLDAQGENEAGRDAIKAWVAAGAAND